MGQLWGLRGLPAEDFTAQHPGKTSLKRGLRAGPLGALSRFLPSEAVSRLELHSIVWFDSTSALRWGRVPSRRLCPFLLFGIFSSAPANSRFSSARITCLLCTLPIRFFGTEISEPDSRRAYKSSRGPAPRGLHPA